MSNSMYAGGLNQADHLARRRLAGLGARLVGLAGAQLLHQFGDQELVAGGLAIINTRNLRAVVSTGRNKTREDEKPRGR